MGQRRRQREVLLRERQRLHDLQRGRAQPGEDMHSPGFVQVVSWLNVKPMELAVLTNRVLCETFLRPIVYRPKMGIAKARKLGVRSKILFF